MLDGRLSAEDDVAASAPVVSSAVDDEEVIYENEFVEERSPNSSVMELQVWKMGWNGVIFETHGQSDLCVRAKGALNCFLFFK